MRATLIYGAGDIRVEDVPRLLHFLRNNRSDSAWWLPVGVVAAEPSIQASRARSGARMYCS